MNVCLVIHCVSTSFRIIFRVAKSISLKQKLSKSQSQKMHLPNIEET